MPKTATAEELLAAIDTVLRGQVYIPQGCTRTSGKNSGKLKPLSVREL